MLRNSDFNNLQNKIKVFLIKQRQTHTTSLTKERPISLEQIGLFSSFICSWEQDWWFFCEVSL